MVAETRGGVEGREVPMMDVECAHLWGAKIEFTDDDQRRMGYLCRRCQAIWYDGEPMPNVVIGKIVQRG